MPTDTMPTDAYAIRGEITVLELRMLDLHHVARTQGPDAAFPALAEAMDRRLTLRARLALLEQADDG